MNRMIVTWKYGTPEGLKQTYVESLDFAKLLSKRITSRHEEEYIFEKFRDCRVPTDWPYSCYMVRLEFCYEVPT